MTGPGVRPSAGSSRVRRFAHILGIIASGIGLFFVWSLAGQLFIIMPALAGLVWLLAVGALFVWLYAFRGDVAAARNRIRFRLGPLGRHTRVVLKAIPAMLLFGLGCAGLIALTGTSVELPPTVRESMATPAGWAAFAVFAIVFQPLVEEFFFRGWIQRPLERLLGPITGVVTTAALFGALHFWYGSLVALLVPFALGLIWGAAAYITRTILASMLMHVAWNATLLLGQALTRDPPDAPDTLALDPFAQAALLGLLVVGGGAALVRLGNRARAEPTPAL